MGRVVTTVIATEFTSCCPFFVCQQLPHAFTLPHNLGLQFAFESLKVNLKLENLLMVCSKT